MDYEEAKKIVQSTKPSENFLMVKLGYDNVLVLPYKDGISLINSLANAERLHGDYSNKHIVGMETGSQEFYVMSRQEYEIYKISALLNISFTEAQALHQTPPTP